MNLLQKMFGNSPPKELLSVTCRWSLLPKLLKLSDARDGCQEI